MLMFMASGLPGVVGVGVTRATVGTQGDARILRLHSGIITSITDAVDIEMRVSAILESP